MDFKLTDEQQAVIDAMVTLRHGRILCLNGAAGTGKSAVIGAAREMFDLLVIGCPTGQAASIVKGSTIHKLFGIPTDKVLNPNYKEHPVQQQRWTDRGARFFGGKRTEPIKACNWLILDECSMVRCDHFDFINAAMQQIRKCDEPFGGCGVLMVGDFGQLPPVATEKDVDKLLDFGYMYPFGIRESFTIRQL